MRLGWRNGKSDQSTTELLSPQPQIAASMPEPVASAHVPDSGSAQPAERPQDCIHLSEARAKRLAASRQSAALLGDVVRLLARSPKYKHHSLADLEWLVAPALRTGQFQMAEGLDPSTGARGPLALVLWASVSDEAEGRLRFIDQE